MKQIFLISLLLLVAMQVPCQVQEADSLVNVLDSNTLPAEKQLLIYNDICYDYLISDPQKAMLYIQKALSLAEKENNKAWMSGFNSFFGDAYQKEGNYEKALDYYNKALNIAIDAKKDDKEAYAYSSIASLYHRQGKIVTSLDYLLKALSIYEQGKTDNYKKRAVHMLVNIGEIHRNLENTDLAIQFLTRAEKIAKEFNYPEGEMGVYFSLSNIYRWKKEYKKAMDYSLKSLELSRYFGDKSYETGNLGTLALIYEEGFNDHKKSEKYAVEGLDVAKKINDPYILMGAWSTLSNVYLSQKRYTEAENAAMTAWEIDTTYINQAYYLMYNIGIANMYLGNKDKAAYYLEKSKELREQSANKSFQNVLIDSETKYETQKKEIRIASLEKERRLYIWLGVAGGLLLISMGIGMLQTIRNARKERQLIASKAVQDGELNERARLAEDLHDRLGGSLSAVKIELKNAESLQNVSDKLDECIKEVREITHNLMPRSLRLLGMKGALEDFTAQFPNVHFHFFGQEKRIRERLEFAVFCCASELITNSLRHSGAENINVQLLQDDKSVSLVVHDDGCGFDEKTVAKGIGLKNIYDRVASFNGKLDIASSPGNGTETIINMRVEN